MMRAIDHVVHASRDLAAQAAFYRKLGFTLGARNHHPWGTENHIIQFADHFIELISRGAGFRAPVDMDPHTFSFAGFVSQQLEKCEGVSMLALQTKDASADRKQFKSVGLGDFESFHFERKGKRADGADSHVAFTLAFAHSKLMPDIGFFTCQQHFPEEFYSAQLQAHANGAIGVSGIVIVAENPAAHAEFLSGITGQREMLATSLGIDLEVADEQSIEVLTEAAFAQKFGSGLLDRPARVPHVAAVRIAVRDLGACAEILEDNGVPHEVFGHRLLISPEAAFGVALAFEAETV
jgi:catechol 2,3-dioxygenase-like lactoylglutathione lyase family enzyme